MLISQSDSFRITLRFFEMAKVVLKLIDFAFFSKRFFDRHSSEYLFVFYASSLVR